MSTMEKLVDVIERELGRSIEGVARFAKDLADDRGGHKVPDASGHVNPRALRYGAENAIEHAARVEVLSSIDKKIAMCAGDFDDVVSFMKERLVEEASGINNSSTSHVANAYQRTVVSTLADLVRRFS